MSNERAYVVRMPGDTKKQFHVMRFNNLDVTELKNCKMEREVMFKDSKETVEQELPEFGAGSEFGRKEKEEARRRKYEKRKNKSNNSPWILQVGGKNGKKYRGIREGGVSENASYYVFFQAADGMFEAFPVSEWYNFSPFQRYKTMSAEEAEEKYLKRDQILNYFPLRMMAKTKTESDKDDLMGGMKTGAKLKREFKVSDMDDWYDMSENEIDENSEDEEKYKVKREKKEKRKVKKEEDEEEEEEPLEDSDEGDYDDKEVDYMSDASSSSLSETEEKGADLKGVEDESALRELVLSDEEDEEAKEEKDKNKDDEKDPNNDVGNEMDGGKLPPDADHKKAKMATAGIKIDNIGNDYLSDSDFDSDDSDLEEPKLAMYFQKSRAAKNAKPMDLPVGGSASKSEATTASAESSKSAAAGNDSRNQGEMEMATGSGADRSPGLKFKHKLVDHQHHHHHHRSDETSLPASKKLKVRQDCGVTEEAVRRYLTRKPMTAADLVQKFKNKTGKLDELTGLLAEILRKINPDKQNIKGKMYLSLKPT